MQAWQVYLEELRQRIPDGTGDVFGREQLISEAAHDAYQRASDRMTRDHGWEDERTLVVMRGLNAAVKDWIGRGDSSWDTLGDDLQRREAEATNGVTS